MRRIAVLAVALCGIAALPAAAAEMSVSGMVAPTLGVSMDPGSAATASGTVDAEVTRERRGDVVIVTVFPR